LQVLYGNYTLLCKAHCNVVEIQHEETDSH